jgi:hypothetical protein
MKKFLGLLLCFALLAAACAADNIAQHEPTEFTSEFIVLGAGTEFSISGVLTVPDDRENIPAVVLVHGSGTHDMDSTIFENKPFRDIAEYLSANGIAVLRYNMRTFSHSGRINRSTLTVREEKIEDAILAAEFLRNDPRIDSDRIFILGHSLGGILAPRIHADGGDFAGLILFAGSPRFLLDIGKDQNIAYIEETFTGVERTIYIRRVEAQFKQIAELLYLSDEEAKQTEFDAGMYVYYLKDLYNNPAADFIAEITVPFLVMHPENDMQVFVENDFELYKELLAGRDNVTFKLYPGLNHLFMPGERAGINELMEQYEVPGNVDEQVLADIVNWIHAN